MFFRGAAYRGGGFDSMTQDSAEHFHYKLSGVLCFSAWQAHHAPLEQKT